MKHNPEKRAWRGRSYKKGGERVSDLRDEHRGLDEETRYALADGHCAVCAGPLELLGTLGNTNHYRCRSCGIDSMRKAR